MLCTNDSSGDALGSQYQNIIWSILFTECSDNTFIYTNISSVLGNFDDKKEHIDAITKFMNIKDNYTNLNDISSSESVTVNKWPIFYKNIEHNMEYYHSSDSFNKIQNLYFKGKINPFDHAYINVAVHIRRPATFDVRIEGANTPHEYYFNCINVINNTITSPVLFHIYSQGKQEDYNIYNKFNVKYHLNEDVFDTFVALTYADILITSASSFSYIAALLSKGEIIYLPFWHTPRKHWKIINIS